MKRYFIGLITLSAIVLLGAACNIPPAKTQLPTANGENQNQHSLVNRDEVGCKGSDLFVLSSSSGRVPVDNAGNYTTTFSTERAQAISLKDSNDNLCARAISLPKNRGMVIFDAKSSAITTIFSTIGILTKYSENPEEDLIRIEQLNSFAAFYDYVKLNLPNQNLESLSEDLVFQDLLTECLKELVPDFPWDELEEK